MSMRIGYSSVSPDFSHPADRRKFHFYLQAKGIDFEPARLDGDYDLVYVTVTSDLDAWQKYKLDRAAIGKKVQIVFDLSDAYLASDQFELRDALRGIFFYLSGRTSRFRLSFKSVLIEMIRNSDAIVCGSPEQQEILRQYHDNVHVIYDCFDKDLRARKESYEIPDGEVNIVWEGLSHGNIGIFQMLAEILSGLRGRKINLHMITDQKYCRFSSKYHCRATASVLERVFSGSGVKVYFYSWHPATFARIATSCDLAMIPIPEDPIMRLKPESKLILLWSLGIPVITTATASYARTMDDAGVHWYCADHAEWMERIESLVGSSDVREDYMRSVGKYLLERHSTGALLGRWDALLDTLK